MPQLKELINYIHNEQLGEDALTDQIYQELKRIRKIREWRDRYMTFEEHLIRREAQGEKRGLRKGIHEGKQELAKELIDAGLITKEDLQKIESKKKK